MNLPIKSQIVSVDILKECRHLQRVIKRGAEDCPLSSCPAPNLNPSELLLPLRYRLGQDLIETGLAGFVLEIGTRIGDVHVGYRQFELHGGRRVVWLKAQVDSDVISGGDRLSGSFRFARPRREIMKRSTEPGDKIDFESTVPFGKCAERPDDSFDFLRLGQDAHFAGRAFSLAERARDLDQ